MVQMNWFAGQKLRHRCREQMYGHQGWKMAGVGSGGVMNWEIGIDMYTLMCIKWITIKNPLYKKIKKIKKRASLVAQWLSVCLPMQGTRVRALVWEDPTCHGAAGPVSHNY